MGNLNKLMNMDSVYLKRLYKTSCLAFRTENKFAKKGGVVFVGDSITDFCNLEIFYPGLKAANRGISGDTIEGIKGRLEESIFGLAPKLVVILGGANNFAPGYDDVETFVIDTYRSILEQVKARLPETKVLVQSVYPVSDVSFHNRYKYGHGHIQSINRKLEELTHSLGYEFADVYSLLTSGDEEFDKRFTDDGLHPNIHGYKVISHYLRPIIDDMLGARKALPEERKHFNFKGLTSLQEKEVVTSFVEKTLICVLLFAIGILFCFGISAAVSITLGVILCIYGIVNLIVIFVGRRPLFSVMGVLDGVIVAVGIAFCTHDLSTVIVLLIPFVMEFVGIVTFVDAFIGFFRLKQGGVVRLVTLASTGAVMGALGLSLLLLKDFRESYSQLIAGLLLCLSAATLMTFTVLQIVGWVTRHKASLDE